MTYQFICNMKNVTILWVKEQNYFPETNLDKLSSNPIYAECSNAVLYPESFSTKSLVIPLSSK